MTSPISGEPNKIPSAFQKFDKNNNNTIDGEEVTKDFVFLFDGAPVQDRKKVYQCLLPEAKKKLFSGLITSKQPGCLVVPEILSTMDKGQKENLILSLSDLYSYTNEASKKQFADAIFEVAVSIIKQMPPMGETDTKNAIINVLKFINENMKSSQDVPGAKSRKPCEWRAAKILAEGNFYGCTEMATLFQELLIAVNPNINTKYVSGFYLDWAISCKEENPDFNVKDAPGHAVIEVTDTNDSSTFFVDPGGFYKLIPKTTDANASKLDGDVPQKTDICDILVKKEQDKFYISYYKYGCVRAPEFKIGEETFPFNTIEEVNSHLAAKFGNVTFKELETLKLIKKELKYNDSEKSYFRSGYLEFIIFDKSDKMPFNTDFGENGSTTATIRAAKKWITESKEEVNLYINKIHPAFEEFDKNNDGRISKEEIIQSGDEVAKKFIKLDDLTKRFWITAFNRMHLDAGAKKEFLKSLINIYNRTTNPEEKKLCSDALFELAVYQIKQMKRLNEVNGLIINIIKFMCQNAITRDTEADKCARSSQEILASGEVNGCYEAAKLFSDLLRRINPGIENYFVCAFDENLATEHLSTIKDRPRMSGLTIDQQKEEIRKWIKKRRDEEKDAIKVGGHVVIEIRNPKANNTKESIFLVDPSGFRNIDKALEKNENISFKKLEDRHIIKYEQKPIIHKEKHKNIEKPKYGVLKSNKEENIIYAKSKNALYINEDDLRIDHIRKALLWLECLEGPDNYEPDYIVINLLISKQTPPTSYLKYN